jgi:hypothetical protein
LLRQIWRPPPPIPPYFPFSILLVPILQFPFCFRPVVNAFHLPVRPSTTCKVECAIPNKISSLKQVIRSRAWRHVSLQPHWHVYSLADGWAHSRATKSSLLKHRKRREARDRRLETFLPPHEKLCPPPCPEGQGDGNECRPRQGGRVRRDGRGSRDGVLDGDCGAAAARDSVQQAEVQAPAVDEPESIWHR